MNSFGEFDVSPHKVIGAFQRWPLSDITSLKETLTLVMFYPIYFVIKRNQSAFHVEFGLIVTI